MDYLRVPVTDEKAPKDRDFELLIQVQLRRWVTALGQSCGPDSQRLRFAGGMRDC